MEDFFGSYYLPFEVYFKGFLGRFGWAEYSFSLTCPARRARPLRGARLLLRQRAVATARDAPRPAGPSR